MSVWLETDRAFYLGGQAWIVEENLEIAWAEKHVVRNPALSWVLGKFVEADKANSNKQYFSLDGLKLAQPSILHAPMNMNHSSRRVVGTYVATELVYPTDTADASDPSHPYIEALGVFWKHYFPEEHHLIESAAKDGMLYFSMECLPRQVKCFGEGGCESVFDYDGPSSPTYCAHLNERSSDKYLIEPHFTAGAILVPPVKPGWKDASAEQLSQLVATSAAEMEMAYNGIANSAPQLSTTDWESMMFQLLEFSRDVGTKERKNLAKKGEAMPDGSYPIANTADLKNAIQAIGRAKNPIAVKAHIKHMAKKMGASDMIPGGWT